MLSENEISEDLADDPIRLFDFERDRVLQYTGGTRLPGKDPAHCADGELKDLLPQLGQGPLGNDNTSNFPNQSSNNIKLLDRSHSGKCVQGTNNDSILNNDVSNVNKAECSTSSVSETYGKVTINRKDDKSCDSGRKTRLKDIDRVTGVAGVAGVAGAPTNMRILKDRDHEKVSDIDIYERIIGMAYQNVKALYETFLDNSDNTNKNNVINEDPNIEKQTPPDKISGDKRAQRSSKTYKSSKKIPTCEFSSNAKKPKRVCRSKSLNFNSQQNQALDRGTSLQVNNLTNARTDGQSEETAKTLDNRMSKMRSSVKTKKNTIGNKRKDSVSNREAAMSDQPAINRNVSAVPKKRRHTISSSLPYDQNIKSSIKTCEKKQKYSYEARVMPHFHIHRACNDVTITQNKNKKNTILKINSNRKLNEHCGELQANTKTNATDTTFDGVKEKMPPLSKQSSTAVILNNSSCGLSKIFKNYNKKTAMPPNSFLQNSFTVESCGNVEGCNLNNKIAHPMYSNTPKVVHSGLVTVSSNTGVSSRPNTYNPCHEKTVVKTQMTVRSNDSSSPQSIPVLIRRNIQHVQQNTFDLCSHPISAPVTKSDISTIFPSSGTSYSNILNSNLQEIDINTQMMNSARNVYATSNVSAELPYDCSSMRGRPLYYSQLQADQYPISNISQFNNNIQLKSSLNSNIPYNIPTKISSMITRKSNRLLLLKPPVPFVNKSASNNISIYPNRSESSKSTLSNKLNNNATNSSTSIQHQPTETLVFNTSRTKIILKLYTSQFISSKPPTPNRTVIESDNISKTYSKQLIINSKDNSIDPILQHNTIENNKEVENIIQSKNLITDLPKTYNTTRSEDFNEAIENGTICHSQKIEEDNMKKQLSDDSTLNDSIFFENHEHIDNDTDQGKMDTSTKSDINNIVHTSIVTKNPHLLKEQKNPSEVGSSPFNTEKTLLEQCVNIGNHDLTKTLPSNKFSPPILPILSFEAILEGLENGKYLGYKYNSNSVTDCNGQDSRYLENETQVAEDKNKRTKKITFGEYKRRFKQNKNYRRQ